MEKLHPRTSYGLLGVSAKALSSFALCSCRKNGIHCVSACDNCHGTDFSNVRTDVDDANDSDTDSEHDSSHDVSGVVSKSMPNIVLDDDLYFKDEEEV